MVKREDNKYFVDKNSTYNVEKMVREGLTLDEAIKKEIGSIFPDERPTLCNCIFFTRFAIVE